MYKLSLNLFKKVMWFLLVMEKLRNQRRGKAGNKRWELYNNERDCHTEEYV